MNKLRASLLLLLVMLLNAGCAETNIHAIERLRPAYSLYRNDLASAIVGLPPVGSVQTWNVPATIFPAPVFFEDRMNEPSATTEIIYFGERNEIVSLSIRSPIHFCLAWTGPKNPLHPDAWNDRGGLGEECEAALKRPWLVVLRVAESRLPERLRMEAFLVHVPNWTVVGSFPIVVHGRHHQEDMGRGVGAKQYNEGATSAFHQAASCELLLNLNKLPGGKFQFDYRHCDGAFLSIAVPASLSKEVAGESDRSDVPAPPP